MKKRLLAIMLFCIFLLSLAGCKNKESTTLAETTQIPNDTVNLEETTKTSIPTPQNAKWHDFFFGRATWDPVADADFYEVEFVGRKYIITKNWCDLAGCLKYNDSNTFKVRACFKNNDNSDWILSEVLNLTENVYWNDYPDGAFPHNVNSLTYSQTNTWTYENDTRYYLNQYGIRAAGWLDNGGKRYYMNPDGSMYTGWKYIGGSIYYFHPKYGYMICCTSMEIDGTRYNFDNRGHLVTDVWMYEEKYEKPYYIDGTGNRAISRFFTFGGETYYANSYGFIVMNTWKKIDGDYYYFYSDGRLAKNTIVNGKYTVDIHGRLIK